MLFANHTLSKRLEHAEASHLALAAEMYANQVPGPTLLRVAGGVAAFFGADIQLSRAVGLGMSGPVSETDVDALESFYRGRAPAVKLLVSAHADATLFEQLGARDFRLHELDTVLVRPIDPTEVFPSIRTRVATADEAAVWVRTSISGFLDSDAPPPPGGPAPVYEALFAMPTSTYLFGMVDGAPRATAAIDIQASTAQLFAAATLPSSRGRGLQSALITARLALAQAAGCDLAVLRTAAGSASQRHAEKLGFRPVYSRATMSKLL